MTAGDSALEKASQCDCSSLGTIGDELTQVQTTLRTCLLDIETLRGQQALIICKHEESDELRRGQIDCISERVFQTERELHRATQKQQDAIEKANAAFHARSFEAQQDRQHVANTVAHINKNLEQISQSVLNDTASLTALQHDVAMLRHTTQEQQQHHVDIRMSLQAFQDQIIHVTPIGRFLEAEAKYNLLSKQFNELYSLTMCLNSQMTDAQDELRLLAQKTQPTLGATTVHEVGQQQFYRPLQSLRLRSQKVRIRSFI